MNRFGPTYAPRLSDEKMQPSHQARMCLALFLSILFIGLVMPRGIVHANVILGSFPDHTAWQGIEAIVVEQVVFQNMESVNLTPELVRVRLHNALRQTGLAILSGIEAKGHGERGPIRPHVGMLAMRVRMDKTSMPWGGKLHSFAITLTFFSTRGSTAPNGKPWQSPGRIAGA